MCVPECSTYHPRHNTIQLPRRTPPHPAAPHRTPPHPTATPPQPHRMPPHTRPRQALHRMSKFHTGQLVGTHHGPATVRAVYDDGDVALAWGTDPSLYTVSPSDVWVLPAGVCADGSALAGAAAGPINKRARKRARGPVALPGPGRKKRRLRVRGSALRAALAITAQAAVDRCRASARSDTFVARVRAPCRARAGELGGVVTARLPASVLDGVNATYKQMRGEQRFVPRPREVLQLARHLLRAGVLARSVRVCRCELPGFSTKSPAPRELVDVEIVSVDDRGLVVRACGLAGEQRAPLSLLANLEMRELLAGPGRLSAREATAVERAWGPDTVEKGAQRPRGLVAMCAERHGERPAHATTLDGDCSNVLQFLRAGVRSVRVLERDPVSYLFMAMLAGSALGVLFPGTRVDVRRVRDAREHLVDDAYPGTGPVLLYMDFLGHPQDWVAEVYTLSTELGRAGRRLVAASVSCLRGYRHAVPHTDHPPHEVDFGLFMDALVTNQTCGQNDNMKMSVHTTPRTEGHAWSVFKVPAGDGVQLRAVDWGLLPNSKLAGEWFPDGATADSWLSRHHREYKLVPMPAAGRARSCPGTPGCAAGRSNATVGIMGN